MRRSFSALLAFLLLSAPHSWAIPVEMASPAITITAKPTPSDLLTAPQSAYVVQGRALDQARGMNFSEAIQNTPGVSAFTSGNFVSKPVIRGLTSNRVLIVQDGIRQETQQWGEEHGTQIDTLSVERYEVLRGPNSLLYGSDALGGVIAASSHPLLRAPAGESKLGGAIRMDGFTGSRQFAGNLLMQGAQGAFGYAGHMTRRKSHDYTTPLGRLNNTGVEELNGGARVGWTQGWGAMDLGYARIDQEIQLADADPAATPYQKLQNDRGAVHLNIPTPIARLEFAGSYAQNKRQEFEESDAANSVLNLLLKTSTFDIRAHHEPLGLVKGTIGVSAFQQTNSTRGEETLIPNYTHHGFGGYVFEELPLGKLTLTGGIRGDGSRLNADQNTALGNANEKLKYSSLTGALGATYRVVDPFTLALNVGRGYRAPSAFELFSNGPHEGSNRFEVGNKNLKPEESFNVDFAARWSAPRVRSEVTFFRNLIDDYIFSAPTGTTDAASGFDIFNFTQGQAELIGSEWSLEGDATPWLLLSTGYDIVRGRNKSTDQNLPLIPADRLKFGARLHYSEARWKNIQNPYLGANTKLVRKQSKLDPNEIQTGGYTLWDLSSGFELPVGKMALSIDMGVSNLLDKRYTDHLARNKAFALEPGRNVFVKLTLPFGHQK